jgi:hypothetical protein
LLAFGLRYLVRSWRAGGTIGEAVTAGLALTLASALRYEIWMILPFLAAPLLPQWKKLFAFVGAAMVHPIAWMIGCWIKFGNPAYSFMWSDSYERDLMKHNQTVDFAMIVRKLVELTSTTAHGLSWPLTALAALGVITVIVRRRREVVWLLAPTVLFAMVVYAGTRGSLWYKPSYTLTYGAFAVPFVAALFAGLQIDRWSSRRCVVVIAGVVAAILSTTITPLWNAIPHGRSLYAQAVGYFDQQNETRELIGMINGNQAMGSKPLVTDFIGWEATGFVTSRVKIEPASLCTPSGTPVPVDIPAVQTFLLKHREGTLLTYDKGRLTAELKMDSPTSGTLAGVPLQLTTARTLVWPGGAAAESAAGTMTVSEYRVVGEPAERDTRPAKCTTPCPVSLCSI